MAYTESESMAIKRLKVALKRQDWKMYEYGITRTVELINSGVIVSELAEWHRILEESKTENAPEELIEKLKDLIEKILQKKQIEAEKIEAERLPEKPKAIDVNLEAKPKTIIPQIPLTIFLNGIISDYDLKTVQKLKDYLNSLSVEPSTKTDPTFLNYLSELINRTEKENACLKGIEDLLKLYPGPGTIITSTYSPEIINILRKNNIDFYIEGIHRPTSSTYWNILPLTGITNIFYCPACKTRSFYPELTKSILVTCHNCHSAAYPDLYYTDIPETLVNPRTWYLAYQALMDSANWMLISPPGVTEKASIYNLILEASLNSSANNTFIISENTELGNWWKNKIEENISECNVTSPCFNIDIALKHYINTINN